MASPEGGERQGPIHSGNDKDVQSLEGEGASDLRTPPEVSKRLSNELMRHKGVPEDLMKGGERQGPIHSGNDKDVQSLEGEGASDLRTPPEVSKRLSNELMRHKGVPEDLTKGGERQGPIHSGNDKDVQSLEGEGASDLRTPPEVSKRLPNELMRHKDVPKDLTEAVATLLTYLESIKHQHRTLRPFFIDLKNILNKSTLGGKRQGPIHSAPPRVYSHIKGNTLGVHQKLLTLLNISEELFVESKNWQECDIIFLFCPITYRLGSNVKAAMTEVSVYDDKDIILVLMYHTLEPDLSTSGEDWCQTYPKIKLQVPVLFHETKGLIKCQKNDQAIHEIQHFLKTEGNATMDTDMESRNMPEPTKNPCPLH